MAVDASLTIYAGLYSDIEMASGSQVRYYDGSRILSLDIVEEAPCIGLARRVSECTLRITNDHMTNADGWKGPAMSAVNVEDAASMIGLFMRIIVTRGSPQVQARHAFIIDSVDADDDGATIHGLGVDSLLDKTFAETGLSTTLAAGTLMLTWTVVAMSTCGFTRSDILMSGASNTRQPREWVVDPSTKVGDVARGLMAYGGYAIGLQAYGSKGAIEPMAVEENTRYISALGWPEPYMTERKGTLIVKDPTDDTSQTITLDSSVGGTEEIEIPFSSDLTDLSEIGAWAKRRLSDQWYSVDLIGDPFSLYMNKARSTGIYATAWPVATWTDTSGETRKRRMLIQRIEHHYDGGLTQRVYGPLYDTI